MVTAAELALIQALDALDVSASDEAIRKSSATTFAQVSVAAGDTRVFDETPTGAVDGTNPTFTLANTPTAGTTRVYEGGLRKLETTDWSISGDTITFTYNPPNGSYVRCDYEHS
jgi:hypothetical protein